MIGRLTGEIVQCTPGEVILDVGGVGYLLRIPLSTFYVVSAGPAKRKAVLHVHTHVREDALLLFGFATTEERSAFERLISISGVGPRVALAVLSGIEVADLDRAVQRGDRARLERIPGIGRKTAERILLELRELASRSRSKNRDRDKEAASSSPGAEVHGDAVSALMNLGYAGEVAEKAVDVVLADLGSSSPIEQVLKSALRGLQR